MDFRGADDSLNHFVDISQDVNALNELAYNRQVSIADVNEDGWLDIALGADNDGIFDVLAIDGSDQDRFPHPTDAGACFWYGQENFAWTEATEVAGLDNLNDNYLEWYDFFQKQVTPALYWKPNPVPAQPGLDPQRFACRRPYYADAAYADFDNDGWLDLVILDRRQMDEVVKGRAVLYMNNQDGTFTRKTTEFSGIDATGISCEAADLNNDGLIDLIIAGDPDNSGMPCYAEEFEDKVFMNTGLHGAADNHWLRFRFEGINHAQLIGARVELLDPGNGNLLGFRGIYTNQTYKSSSALEAHFGLGDKTCADLRVKIGRAHV